MITVIRFNWNFDRFNDYNGITSHFIAIDSITIKDYSRIIIIVLVFRFTTNRVIFHTRGLFYSYEILKISLVIWKIPMSIFNEIVFNFLNKIIFKYKLDDIRYSSHLREIT